MKSCLILVFSILFVDLAYSQNDETTSKHVNTKLMDLGAGLIVYYPFYGNANDASENEEHGIANGEEGPICLY